MKKNQQMNKKTQNQTNKQTPRQNKKIPPPKKKTKKIQAALVDEGISVDFSKKKTKLHFIK